MTEPTPSKKTLFNRWIRTLRFTSPLAFNVATTIFIVLVTLIFSWILEPQVGRSLFILSDVRVNGPSYLCPGDTLDFEFDVIIKEEGTYNLWMSTWKVDPPPSTIVFSEIQPFVVGSDREFPIPREWLIPATYIDPGNNKDTPMVPGEYIRDISITAEGRNTRNKPLQVRFWIRKDCELSNEPK